MADELVMCVSDDSAAVSVMSSDLSLTALASSGYLPTNPVDVDLNPSGALLAIVYGTGNRLTVINTSDWSVVSGTPSIAGTSNGVAFSPDGSLLAVAHVSGNRLTVINTSDWSVVSGTPSITSTGNGVAFSPNGGLLAAGHASGNNLTVINTDDWSIVSGTPSLAGTAYGVAFSPDGSLLAVAHFSGNRLTVLNTNDWSVVSGTPSITSTGRDVAFSPDGSLLAVAHDSGNRLTVINTSDWSVVSGNLNESQNAKSVSFNSSGTLLAGSFSSTTDSVRIFNTSDWSRNNDATVIDGGCDGVLFTHTAILKQVSGTIRDSGGSGASRDVVVFDRRDVGNFRSVESDLSGSYSVPVAGVFETIRIALADDVAEGEIFNHLIDRVIPE